MGNTNITKLTFRNECLRVAVDRKEPWFFTDDIVALADIEDKASAMEKAILHQDKRDDIQFEKLFVLDQDGKETLHDITNYDGAFSLVYHAGRFGIHDVQYFAERDTWLDAYADWLFGSATDLIDSQWNRRVKDYEMRLELEDKDRKLAELTRKIQGFATAVQPPPLKTTGPVGAQVQ